MSFHYCDQFLDAAPAHRCLCTRRQRHRGAHECLCTHSWGDTWSNMPYDQQRAWLGLPLKPININLDDLKVAILALLQTDSNFPPARHEDQP